MFTRVIADDPYRKNVYIEIYFKGKLFAEIIHENDINEIIFYNHPHGDWGSIPLDDYIEVLKKANDDILFKKNKKNYSGY